MTSNTQFILQNITMLCAYYFANMLCYVKMVGDWLLPSSLCLPGWQLYIHCISNINDTALACYNFELHQPILIMFGKNVAKKVRSQTVLYRTYPPHLTSASALPVKNTETPMLYYCFFKIKPVAAWLHFCWNATHIHAAIDSINLVINWV